MSLAAMPTATSEKKVDKLPLYRGNCNLKIQNPYKGCKYVVEGHFEKSSKLVQERNAKRVSNYI